LIDRGFGERGTRQSFWRPVIFPARILELGRWRISKAPVDLRGKSSSIAGYWPSGFGCSVVSTAENGISPVFDGAAQSRAHMRNLHYGVPSVGSTCILSAGKVCSRG